MKSRVLAALLGLLLLAVPELLLRLAGFEREPAAPSLPRFLFADFLADEENFQLDSQLFWRYRPGRPILQYLQHESADYRTNAQGYRGPEGREARAPGTLRIAFFGDSNTFGLYLPLRDTVAEQLTDLVHRRSGRPVEAMNFGVLGYSSFQGLRLLRQMIPRYRPDVVVFWFGINDSQPAPVPDSQVTMPDPSLLALTRRLEHLRLWQLVRHVLSPAMETRGAETERLTFRVSVKEFAANLAAARDDCARNGAALLVPNYPSLLLRKAAHLRELVELAQRAGISEVMGGDELRMYKRELAIWNLGGHLKTGQWSTGQNRPMATTPTC